MGFWGFGVLGFCGELAATLSAFALLRFALFCSESATT
jgi:hypothetical protein